MNSCISEDVYKPSIPTHSPRIDIEVNEHNLTKQDIFRNKNLQIYLFIFQVLNSRITSIFQTKDEVGKKEETFPLIMGEELSALVQTREEEALEYSAAANGQWP